MYESIQGLISYLTPEYAVITTNGVGYKILIPVNLFTSLLQTGKETTLFTSLVVREDDIRLFGFISRNDRDLFELLTSISGIGPKTALSIIGHMSLNDLHGAIETHNITLLCKIPGIGKKSAERMIVELKDRLKPDTSLPKAPQNALTQDATLALIRLGYNQKAAETAIKKAMVGATPSDLPKLITLALKNI